MTVEERLQFRQLLDQGADPRLVLLLMHKAQIEAKIAFAQEHFVEHPVWSKTLEVEQHKLRLLEHVLQQRQGVA